MPKGIRSSNVARLIDLANKLVEELKDYSDQASEYIADAEAYRKIKPVLSAAFAPPVESGTTEEQPPTPRKRPGRKPKDNGGSNGGDTEVTTDTPPDA